MASPRTVIESGWSQSARARSRPLLRSSGSLLVCVGLLLAGPADAQQAWSQVNVGPTMRPPARVQHAMVYDSARDRVVMYGGRGTPSSNQFFADTWEWDGQVWTQVLGAGVAGGALAEHSMAYDSWRHRTVLFGGAGAVGNDGTYEFDGTLWTFRPVVGARPSGPSGTAMAFDSVRGRTILAGGWGNDTWEWDGSVWIHLQPANSPPAYQGNKHALAFDIARNRTVLVGSTPYLSTWTWEWDGSNWTERLPPHAPSPRTGFALTFDSNRGRVVLFGGRDGASTFRRFADTWEWDGSDWTQVVTGTSPPARNQHALAFDSQRMRPVLFGGDAGINSFDDTWEYLRTYPASVSSFGAGCPGTAGTPTLSADGASLPWIAGPFSVRLDNIGAHPFFNVPFVLAGFSRTAWGTQSLPFDLSPYGMTGCSLLAEPALAFTLANQGGFALWTVGLPNDPRIAGSSLFIQGGTTSFGANPLGIVLSNACDVAIGAR